MTISPTEFREFVQLVKRWGQVKSLTQWNRELINPDPDPEDIDDEHAEVDKIAMEWRRRLEDLVAGTDLDADKIAHDIHAWGAAEVESARRSAAAMINPDRPQLGPVQLDGETDADDAHRRWAQPLADLVDGPILPPVQ